MRKQLNNTHNSVCLKTCTYHISLNLYKFSNSAVTDVEHYSYIYFSEYFLS